MGSREIAEKVVEAWEYMEGESMRDGHKYTLVSLIECTLDRKCFITPEGDCLTPICNLHNITL